MKSHVSYLVDVRCAGALCTYIHVLFIFLLHSLGSTAALHYYPRSVPFSITVCQSNPSPVLFCCTQYGKAREVCIQFMEALTGYTGGGTKCGSGYISALHHGVSNGLCVSERYKVIVGNHARLITGTERVCINM